MQLRTVPARRGALWVRQGFAVFFARPLSFMALFGVLLLGMVFAQVLPWIGPVLFWVALPLITLGFMIATQQTLQGLVPTPAVFVLPMQTTPNRRALWQLGISYAATMTVVLLIYGWIDGGRTQALQVHAVSEKSTPESVAALIADPRLQLGMLWFALAAAMASVPFWHAPALVHWAGHSAGKALFSSTLACWRNKGAFFVYALTGVAVVMAFAMLSSLVFAVLGQPNVAPLAMAPAMLMFIAVFYASLYFTFADCFEDRPASTPNTSFFDQEPPP